MSPRVMSASFRDSNPNVLLLSVGIMLASSMIASVGAAKNTMSVPQWNHADAMAKITLTAPRIGMNVFALHTNEYGNQLWMPAVITAIHTMTNGGDDEITVMWLNGDELFCRVSIANVRERDNTVTYNNFELDGFTSYPVRNSGGVGGSAVRNSGGVGGSAVRNSGGVGGSAVRNSGAAGASTVRPCGASGSFSTDSSEDKKPSVVESTSDEMTKAKIAKLTQQRDNAREQRDDAREQYDDLLVERTYFVGERNLYYAERNTARHERDDAEQRRLDSELRATAAERRADEMQAELNRFHRAQRSRNPSTTGVHDHGNCRDFPPMKNERKRDRM